MRKPVVLVSATVALLAALIATVFAMRFGNLAATQTVEIHDVTKAQTLILKKRFFQDTIESMYVEGSGFIDGKARIQRIIDSPGGGPYDDDEISGKVHFQWGGDWYSDTAKIRYIPENVKSGYIKLTFSFNVL